MKATEQYFKVVLFIFYHFAKWNSIFFTSVLNLALLGVKRLIVLALFWQAYVDKAFNNEILALDVKCKNNEWGCKWEGEFQNYQVS